VKTDHFPWSAALRGIVPFPADCHSGEWIYCLLESQKKPPCAVIFHKMPWWHRARFGLGWRAHSANYCSRPFGLILILSYRRKLVLLPWLVSEMCRVGRKIPQTQLLQCPGCRPWMW